MSRVLKSGPQNKASYSRMKGLLQNKGKQCLQILLFIEGYSSGGGSVSRRRVSSLELTGHLAYICMYILHYPFLTNPSYSIHFQQEAYGFSLILAYARCYKFYSIVVLDLGLWPENALYFLRMRWSWCFCTDLAIWHLAFQDPEAIWKMFADL